MSKGTRFTALYDMYVYENSLRETVKIFVMLAMRTRSWTDHWRANVWETISKLVCTLGKSR